MKIRLRYKLVRWLIDRLSFRECALLYFVVRDKID